MADKQIKKKNHRELFRKIDMMCEEVNSSGSTAEDETETISPMQRVNSSGSTAEDETETISPMQRVLLEQEEKDLAKRKQQYAQILSSTLRI